MKLIVYPNIVSSLKVIDRISITNFINFQEKSQKGDGEGSRLRVRPWLRNITVRRWGFNFMGFHYGWLRRRGGVKNGWNIDYVICERWYGVRWYNVQFENLARSTEKSTVLLLSFKASQVLMAISEVRFCADLETKNILDSLRYIDC